MKAPSWWNDTGLLSTLMQPLSCAYSYVHGLRTNMIKPQKMSVPVLCVGNVTAGGAGKTPTVMSLAYKLTAMGERPHVISRGYGGSITEMVMVDVTVHRAEDVGDEPLLISQAAPCWIGSNRVDSARAAIVRGATVLLMDDGFQNPSLTKDMSLIVVDGGYGLGNGRVIPAGPLREPLAEGLKRADAMLIIGDDVQDIAAQSDDTPVLHAVIEPKATLEEGDYIAFAGIGRPEKFYDTLRSMGANIVATHNFPDHYAYTKGELETLLKEAQDKGARLITTEKDAVKIDDTYRESIAVLPVVLEWGGHTHQIDEMLKNLIADGGV